MNYLAKCNNLLGFYEKKWLRSMMEEIQILTEEFAIDLGGFCAGENRISLVL
jgi:hypothetical protein